MQGFNKYYPPSYDPKEHSSLNSLHGKHALGDRARKLDKGILIVRFELPYNIWCDGCNNHIGQGVRYNAEKSKVGMYYTTPIWNFRCKCHLCQSWFEIRTDPQNTRYVVHSGARQKHEEWDPEENGGIVLDEKDPDGKPPDPFTQLEKTQTQKTRALTAASQLAALEEDRSFHWEDPYAASSLLRDRFRKAKKVRLESEGRAQVVRSKYGLGDRVSVDALRTPAARQDLEEEEREWAEALRQRQQRSEVEQRARDRERESLGWRKGGKDEEQQSRSDRRALDASRSSRPIKGVPSRVKAPSSQSPAVKSLASKLLLDSALKRDPFGGAASAATASASNTSSTRRRRQELEGKIGVKRRRSE